MFFDSHRSGAPAAQADPAAAGPVVQGGISQASAAWLDRQLASDDHGFRLIDVREPHEFDGPLGHIEGSELVPLRSLTEALEGWDRDQPLVMICHSGARSAAAARVLLHFGFRTVHNLEGGMIAWSRRAR